jgi:hypothetical protein
MLNIQPHLHIYLILFNYCLVSIGQALYILPGKAIPLIPQDIVLLN